MCSTSLLYKILPTRKTISYGAVLLSYRPRTKIPFFFCPIQVFNCAIFFTILHDKLYSFSIQDDRSTRFLCTTNYYIELTAWSLLRSCFIIRFVLSKTWANFALCLRWIISFLAYTYCILSQNITKKTNVLQSEEDYKCSF